MQRTQISLADHERALLDAEAARTGRSISALIRDAVTAVYGPRQDVEDDIRVLRTSSGAWGDDGPDGEAWVDRLRSGSRLGDAAER